MGKRSYFWQLFLKLWSEIKQNNVIKHNHVHGFKLKLFFILFDSFLVDEINVDTMQIVLANVYNNVGCNMVATTVSWLAWALLGASLYIYVRHSGYLGSNSG